MHLPSDVIKTRTDLSKVTGLSENRSKTSISELKLNEENQRRYHIIVMLTSFQEHEQMWQSLQRRKGDIVGDWVLDFIDSVNSSLDLPDYFYMTNVNRNNLKKNITKSCNNLINILTEHELNCEIQLGGDTLKSESSLVLLARIMTTTVDKISEVNPTGKAGKTVKATRFIRQLGKRNRGTHGTALNAVIQVATNTFFDTNYEEHDISKLLSR